MWFELWCVQFLYLIGISFNLLCVFWFRMLVSKFKICFLTEFLDFNVLASAQGRSGQGTEKQKHLK